MNSKMKKFLFGQWQVILMMRIYGLTLEQLMIEKKLERIN